MRGGGDNAYARGNVYARYHGNCKEMLKGKASFRRDCS
jgi:hypothetical protein